MNSRPVDRFSRTVEDYIRFRPGYPPALADFMVSELGLSAAHDLADIGSGTGKLTELLLPYAGRIYAVEPNASMRAAAERLLSGNPCFQSIDGTAEGTGLPAASVDFITAAQAFHWFDVEAFRHECRRILRPGGAVLLIWNDRVDAASPFMEAYEHFLRTYSTDYRQVDLRQISSAHFDAFFGPGNYRQAEFRNEQRFDLEGLTGRYLSCSYALPSGHPQYGEGLRRLQRLFEQYAVDDAVHMVYRTVVYYG